MDVILRVQRQLEIAVFEPNFEDEEVKGTVKLNIELIKSNSGCTRMPATPGSPVTKLVTILAINAPNARTERLKNMHDLHLRASKYERTESGSRF